VLHERLARPQIPPFCRARRLLVSPNVAAVEEDHAQRDAALLHAIEQPLPHPGACPADEDLCRLPPRTQLLGDGAPLRPVLMSPEDRRDRAPKLPGGVLAFGRQASISGCNSPRCASDSITSPHWKTRKRQNSKSVQATTGPSTWLSLHDADGQFPVTDPLQKVGMSAPRPWKQGHMTGLGGKRTG